MSKEKIAGKIEALQKEAQARLNVLAQADPVWQNLQGQMGAWNEALGDMEEDVVEAPTAPTVPKNEKAGK